MDHHRKWLFPFVAKWLTFAVEQAIVVISFGFCMIPQITLCQAVFCTGEMSILKPVVLLCSN